MKVEKIRFAYIAKLVWQTGHFVYADLMINGDPEVYLRAVTEYKPVD